MQLQHFHQIQLHFQNNPFQQGYNLRCELHLCCICIMMQPAGVHQYGAKIFMTSRESDLYLVWEIICICVPNMNGIREMVCRPLCMVFSWMLSFQGLKRAQFLICLISAVESIEDLSRFNTPLRSIPGLPKIVEKT